MLRMWLPSHFWEDVMDTLWRYTVSPQGTHVGDERIMSCVSIRRLTFLKWSSLRADISSVCWFYGHPESSPARVVCFCELVFFRCSYHANCKYCSSTYVFRHLVFISIRVRSEIFSTRACVNCTCLECSLEAFARRPSVGLFFLLKGMYSTTRGLSMVLHVC